MRLTTLRIADNAYVCSVGGELAELGVDGFRHELDDVGARGALHVIADLLSVSFIDSAALGLLLTTAERLREAGGELIVVADDPRILRIFEVTGSGRRFRIERSLATAVSDLAGQLYA